MSVAEQRRSSEMEEDGRRMRARAEETLGRATDQARETAGQAGEQAKSMLRQQLDQRSTELGHKVRSQADTLRNISAELRNEGKENQAQVVEKAREQTEQIAHYLERSDADKIMADLEHLARRQPWLVAAGSFAVGLLGARFIKASGHQSEQR